MQWEMEADESWPGTGRDWEATAGNRANDFQHVVSSGDGSMLDSHFGPQPAIINDALLSMSSSTYASFPTTYSNFGFDTGYNPFNLGGDSSTNPFHAPPVMNWQNSVEATRFGGFGTPFAFDATQSQRDFAFTAPVSASGMVCARPSTIALIAGGLPLSSHANLSPMPQSINPAGRRTLIGSVYRRDGVSGYTIRCDKGSCGGVTFSRWHDFERHDSAYHDGASGIWCPYSRCDRSKGPGNRPFPSARKDKLKDHVRRMHAVEHDG